MYRCSHGNNLGTMTSFDACLVIPLKIFPRLLELFLVKDLNIGSLLKLDPIGVLRHLAMIHDCLVCSTQAKVAQTIIKLEK
jgi:hypothetical protein